MNLTTPHLLRPQVEESEHKISDLVAKESVIQEQRSQALISGFRDLDWLSRELDECQRDLQLERERLRLLTSAMAEAQRELAKVPGFIAEGLATSAELKKKDALIGRIAEELVRLLQNRNRLSDSLWQSAESANLICQRFGQKPPSEITDLRNRFGPLLHEPLPAPVQQLRRATIRSEASVIQHRAMQGPLADERRALARRDQVARKQGTAKRIA